MAGRKPEDRRNIGVAGDSEKLGELENGLGTKAEDFVDKEREIDGRKTETQREGRRIASRAKETARYG